MGHATGTALRKLSLDVVPILCKLRDIVGHGIQNLLVYTVILSVPCPYDVSHPSLAPCNAIASSDNAIASGYNLIASGDNAIVSGNNLIALGDNSIASSDN